MTIYLYTNLSEDNRIDKNLDPVLTLDGTLREGTSTIDPQIMIECASAADINKINFMYIPDFGRYYFVNQKDNVVDKLWNLKAHCDVLMTYAEGIRAHRAIVGRQENVYNKNLNDNNI